MKQYEAFIKALEERGGIATLGQLYHDVLKIPGCEWKTKTPFHSIRRIVQERPEIFKVRPGLWALESHRVRLDIARSQTTSTTSTDEVLGHSYYQGLLCELGNLQGYQTFIPHQDQNKLFINQPLHTIRSLQSIYSFSYPRFVRRIGTVDTLWFNQRQMPSHLFEVEHSTDFNNSLLKFVDLQDFNAQFVIVAASIRKAQFADKLNSVAFESIQNRVKFWDYDLLMKKYEHAQILRAYDNTN